MSNLIPWHETRYMLLGTNAKIMWLGQVCRSPVGVNTKCLQMFHEIRNTSCSMKQRSLGNLVTKKCIHMKV